MFCFNCGKEIEDGSVFCPFCGTKLVQDEQKATKQKTTVEKPKKKEEPKVAKEEPKQKEIKEEPIVNTTETKKTPIGLIFGLVGVVIVGIVVACIFLLGGKSLKVLEAVELSFDGYNGYGNAYIYIDEEKNDSFALLQEELNELKEEYQNTCALTNSSSDKCQDLIDKVYHAESALETVDYVILNGDGKSSGEFSNGDTVTIKVEYDKDAFKKAGYKLSSTTKKFKVSGLEELKEADLLSFVEAEWKASGGEFYLAPKITEGCPIEDVPCIISDPDDNGDVTISIDDTELAREYGYKAKGIEDTKTVHVGDTPQVIKNLNADNRYQVTELVLNVINDVYISKCGSTLYSDKGEELIDNPNDSNITSLSVNNGTIRVVFSIGTSFGNKYRKSISFEGYIDSNGEYQCATDFDYDSLSCAVRYGEWPEYD